MANPLFETLQFLDDPTPRGAALNMALDERLLRDATLPLLRVYRWRRDAVSFGYFEKFAPIERAFPDLEFVRRWTGGGVVPHSANGENLTYSVIVPRAHEFAKIAVEDSYLEIHERVVAALQSCAIEASLTANSAPKISQGCFENPVRHDIVVSGKKIAGAAQRRSRFGVLHQGSIQLAALPEDFGLRLANALAAKIESRELSEMTVSEAENLAAQKYGCESWLRKF